MKTIIINNVKYLACETCGKLAEWNYFPGSHGYCDIHVPRGCFCNAIPIDGNYENEDPANWKQELDEKGREIPCCEYWYNENGWVND